MDHEYYGRVVVLGKVSSLAAIIVLHRRISYQRAQEVCRSLSHFYIIFAILSRISRETKEKLRNHDIDKVQVRLSNLFVLHRTRDITSLVDWFN